MARFLRKSHENMFSTTNISYKFPYIIDNKINHRPVEVDLYD